MSLTPQKTQQPPAPVEENPAYARRYFDESYDDGFDDLQSSADEKPELTDEELEEQSRVRVRLALGAGNLFAVISGTVVILVLLTLLLNMINFVVSDMSRSLTLFQTGF